MSADAAPVLETSALSKSFGGLAAVRDVSIALRRGELHAVIGPNGAGKSTLVNLLSGELKPTSGEIRLDGRPVESTSAPRMAQAGVARSFQRTNIFPPLTVHENVRLAAQASCCARVPRLVTSTRVLRPYSSGSASMRRRTALPVRCPTASSG